MTSSACEDTCWNYHDDDISYTLPTISLAPIPVPPKQMLEEELHKVFYDSLGGREWTNNDNWESTDNYCSCYGIACNEEGSVESIVIIDNNMKGKLATEIYLLPNLNMLTISECKIEFDSFQELDEHCKNSPNSPITKLEHGFLYRMEYTLEMFK